MNIKQSEKGNWKVEEIKSEYWRLRNIKGKPLSAIDWRNRNKIYPSLKTIDCFFLGWREFVRICGDTPSREGYTRKVKNEKGIPCNYNGIMIHFSDAEIERLRMVKERIAEQGGVIKTIIGSNGRQYRVRVVECLND